MLPAGKKVAIERPNGRIEVLYKNETAEFRAMGRAEYGPGDADFAAARALLAEQKSVRRPGEPRVA